jgi:beta-lactamase superfamily II metal-dependent hydrolase
MISTKILLASIAFLGIANCVVYNSLPPRHIEFTELSTGKGTATLVSFPHGETLLINSGSDAGIVRELGSALPFSTRHIDVIVLTQAVASTTGGLTAITERYSIGALVRTASTGTKAAERVISEAEVHIAHTGSFTNGAKIVFPNATVEVTAEGVYLVDKNRRVKIR